MENLFKTLPTVPNDDKDDLKYSNNNALSTYKSYHCNPTEIDDDVSGMTTDESDLAEKLDRIASPSPYVAPTDPNLEHGPSGFGGVRPAEFGPGAVRLCRCKRIAKTSLIQYH